MASRSAQMLLFVALSQVLPVTMLFAQEPVYKVLEDDAFTGTRIRRNAKIRTQIAMNLPYEKLSERDRVLLHSLWENIPDGDEPPYPLSGMQPLVEAVHIAHTRMKLPGTVFAVARIGSDGSVKAVRVYEAPHKAFADFMGKVIAVTKFKPAKCSGSPCEMDFPVEYELTLEPR